MAEEPLRILTASDNHVEWQSFATHAELYADSYFAFQQLFTLAQQYSATGLLLAGDVVETQTPDSTSVSVILQTIDRFQEAGIPVWFIQGQHEFMDRLPWLSLHEHPQHIHRKSIRVNGINIYGIDFQPAGRLEKEIADVPPDTDLVVLHQAWKELMKNLPSHGRLADVPYGNAIVTGDYHVHRKFDVVRNRDGRRIPVFSPGSTSLQSLIEDPQKFVFLLEWGAGNTPTHKSIPLLARRVYRIRAEQGDDLSEMLAEVGRRQNHVERNNADGELPPALKKPILAVHRPDSRRDAEIRDFAGDRFHLFLRLIQTDVEDDGTGLTPTGMDAPDEPLTDVWPDLYELIQTSPSSAASRSLASRLWDSENKTQDELDSWVREQLFEGEVTP